MLYVLIFCVFFANVFAAEDVDVRIVVLDGLGALSGEKSWKGDFYEFYGFPYATAPTGRDRFKAPLPLEPWEGVKTADVKNSICQQCYLTDDDEDDIILHGEEDCLTMTAFVPVVANETNLVPVIVYIHSGAFGGGSGNMAKYDYLVRHDVIVINFNYRLGSIGFACLGTEEIPGNAGMKDQVAALKFINKHISKFGGDPNRVTLAGFSVGATMAELLALSKTTDGLIDKLILESGSALNPFAINRDPISTARYMAISIGYNDTGKLEDLNEFYLNASAMDLASKGKNFYLTNSTFGFSPCIERKIENVEPFLTESPLDILIKGGHKKLPIMTGFANMEGISRTIKFAEWRHMMNENFADFLPADLAFKDKTTRETFIKEIRTHYFKDQDVSMETLQAYIDYFSDSMFKYGIMKSAKLHAANSDRPVFLYEFTYVGKLNMKHIYMDRIKGASHRDHTAYLLDFYDFTNKYRDMDTRDRLTTMWTDFSKYENPTAYESSLINVKWLKYKENEPNYLEIGNKLKIKTDLLAKRYQFWDRAYKKHHWNPTPVAVKK